MARKPKAKRGRPKGSVNKAPKNTMVLEIARLRKQVAAYKAELLKQG